MDTSTVFHKTLPFLRPLICYAIGSKLGEYVAIDLLMLTSVESVLVVLLLLTAILPISIKWRVVPILSFILMTHMILISWMHYETDSNYNIQIGDINQPILLKIDEINPSSTSDNNYTATIFKKSKMYATKIGKSIVYFKNNRNPNVQIGDIIFTNAHPEPIVKNDNPGEFDHYSFNRMKGIVYKTSIQPQEFILLGNDKSVLKNIVTSVRTKILRSIRTYISQKDQLGIAEAMLIGYKADLSKSLNNAYSIAGVSHVIAISGMHLGLIYLIIHQIFAAVFKKKQLHIVALFITLPLLWMFAMITGSSASVLRSVIMYSFIIIGNLMIKNSNSLNALLGAGFIMNVYNPDILNDIGFQLSFSAVLGITLLYQPIKKSLYIKNKLLEWGWNLVALSLTAQIITTPFILYHFNQFSTYSILNNILIVPLSSIVLILEIILCLCPFPILCLKLIAPFISMILTWMNDFTAAMNKVPYALITVPILKWYQVLLWTIFFIGIACFILRKEKYPFLMITLTAAIILIAANTFVQHAIKTTQQIILLNLHSSGAIIHQHGHTADVYVYGNQIDGIKAPRKIIASALKTLGVEVHKFKYLPYAPMVVAINSSEKAIFINADKLSGSIDSPLLNQHREWIMDGSTKLWKIREWQKQAQNLHLRFLSTAEKGPIFLDCQGFHPYSRKN